MLVVTDQHNVDVAKGRSRIGRAGSSQLLTFVVTLE
jgi:hypothetical protein